MSNTSTNYPDNINNKVYRHKFSPEVIDVLTRFAKVHSLESRKDYKESWNKWYNLQDFQHEIDRLRNNHFTGDFEDKLYKAGRYYFRKKDLENNTKPKKRRQYITIQHDFIDSVDNHILNNINNTDFSPASGYNSFCSNHKDIIQNESNRLILLNIDNKIIIDKIKKLYKNRYNIIIKNNNNNNK